ncbi:hypothetical protein BGX24_005329 [Mortierella sp. AD032]|nr:hypothetical protein BGX24_005329 [Mortierella sp. AD032]
MTRGNQRDQDRLKAQKKLAAATKGKNTTGVSHTKHYDSKEITAKYNGPWTRIGTEYTDQEEPSTPQRKYDAEIMRAKQAAKEAAKNGGGAAAAPAQK